MAEKEKSATSKEVAKLAGVSQSTVSRVFMQGSSSSPATRKKVLEAARQLNYRPNAFARSLITRESKLIGLVFPDVDYPLHMETLQLLSAELQRQGYSAVLIPWLIDDKQHSIPNIFQYRVDGVIAASAQFNTALFEECERFNIPIVQFARIEEGTQCSSATVDNYEAGVQAARILIEKGAKKPLYLTGDIPSATNTERESGFVDGVLSLTNTSPEILNANYNYHGAVEILKDRFAEYQTPDAVFCSTDVLAMALMDVARFDFNLSIPDDLQVIGFDDTPQASWNSYQLTTFRQDFSRLAKESVKLLMEKINDKTSVLMRVMIPVTLVQRGTTRQ